MTFDSIVVSNLERGLEHLEEPAIYLSLYGHWCRLGIQNKEARSDSSSLVAIPNEERTDLWLTRISSLKNEVGRKVYNMKIIVISLIVQFGS